MRSRSNSGVRLDLYYRIVNQTILKNQNPVTGLIAFSDENRDAWVRDNVYSVSSVWALALAYKKTADVDEDRAKAYELEQSVVKAMRGLMICMMRQVMKVEAFKHTQSPSDSLHAKYSSLNHSTVVSDDAWGHLQIDATSFYLLMLAQMTASGLQIIYTLDEVAFIQNLIFYIESAYRIADYGIWERGDKTNHGLPELNASSIGMAKAAMEAMSGLDLFGSNGSSLSTMQVQADKVAQCNAILQSLLPRESHSKEVDSALLSIIGFPAFAVDDQDIVDLTKKTILNKCLGRYGCCRFMRDGYKTAIEDPHRLHYEPWELQQFENIECEWPVFLAYLSINESFEGNKDKASDYLEKLNKLLIPSPSGVRVVPEMYTVPADKVRDEWSSPGSQDRLPVGQVPHKWGQSLYIISRLLSDGFISPGELDPINRRLAVLPKPDLVVQLVVLAEDDIIRDCLSQVSLKCHSVKSFQEDGRYVLHPAKVLSETFSHLGECSSLGLSGRYAGVGLLATSTLYRYGDTVYCFTPELYDYTTFYLAMNQDFVFDQVQTDLQYLKSNWQMLGRPTMILPIYHWMADFTGELPVEFRRAITKMQSGYFGGVRVQVGNIENFTSTSCVSSIDWLFSSSQDSDEVYRVLGRSTPTRSRSRLSSGARELVGRKSELKETLPSVYGLVKRAISIPGSDPKPSQPTLEELGMLPEEGGATSTTKHRVLNPLGLQQGHLRVSSGSHFPPSIPGNGADRGFSRQDSVNLVKCLLETDEPAAQADILHYLYVTKGPYHEVVMDDTSTCTVSELLEELYHKAGAQKIWWLIRYTAGMLRKRASSLASALSDLLVRQKLVTFGLPTQKEHVITQPLSPEEIALRIESVCTSVESGVCPGSPDMYRAISPHCMLHQELLIYLAMFVRTEPRLFHEMIRVRIGLIIAVMTTELTRCLNCSGEEATSHLLNLSPFELKKLLHHIISGKEFVIQEVEESHLAILSEAEEHQTFLYPKKSIKHKISSPALGLDFCSTLLEESDESEEMCDDSQGQWARRRRIDGALNRAPIGFYTKVWHLLTQMTQGEIKFALQVESVLNHVPEPEYRQLIVEALITLTVFSEMNRTQHFINMIIPVNDIVTKAYHIFLNDGTMTDTCMIHGQSRKSGHSCFKLRDICEAFYDTAPSGAHGTISYMCRALPEVIPLPTVDGTDSVNCLIQ